jgi:hypothetical protein
VRFAFVFILLVAIGGPVVALIWWAIAAKVAPYEDERGREARRRVRDEGARIVRDFDEPGSAPF